MSQKITFTAADQSVELFTERDVADIGALQFVSGTGTVVVEGSLDGLTYVGIALKTSIGDVVAANAAAAGLWWFNCAAYDKVRVRCSAFTADIVCYASVSRS